LFDISCMHNDAMMFYGLGKQLNLVHTGLKLLVAVVL